MGKGRVARWGFFEKWGRGMRSMMRSLRFLHDLQFGLEFEDYAWFKNRSPNCSVLRFALFCKISVIPYWLHLRDIFSWMSLVFLCTKYLSFIFSFIHSINQHYIESLLRENQGFILKISYPPPPSPPYHSHWSSSCQLSIGMWMAHGHFRVNTSNTKPLIPLSQPKLLLF